MTITTPDTLEHALRRAAGPYQENVLHGLDDWSGASLRGKARQYGGRYAESRRNLLHRLTAAGLQVMEVRLGAHGRRDMIVAADRVELHALAVAALSEDVATFKSPAVRVRRLAHHVDTLARHHVGRGIDGVAQLATAAPLADDQRRALVVATADRLGLSAHERLALLDQVRRRVETDPLAA
jgi:hypothetical protein